MGRWAWPVSVVAGLYLALMLVNVVLPTGLGSGRSYFNLDWVTLLVMAVVTVAGIIVYVVVHGGREIDAHMMDTDAPGHLPPAPLGDAAVSGEAATLKEAP